MRQTSNGAIPIRQRVRAVLALRGRSLRDLAEAVGRAEGHLARVLSGERKPSAPLLDALHRELGDAWPFVCGHVDVLGVSVPAGERVQK